MTRNYLVLVRYVDNSVSSKTTTNRWEGPFEAGSAREALDLAIQQGHTVNAPYVDGPRIMKCVESGELIEFELLGGLVQRR